MKTLFGLTLILLVVAACGTSQESTVTSFQALKNILPGDANRDGVVDVLDGAQVQAAGKFGTGLPATWEEGDFNGDGKVTLADITLLNNNFGK